MLGTHRDRGEPRDSSPPTPPYIRVRIRRFDGLSTVGVSRRAGESDNGVRRNGFGPFERRVQASPFPIAAKASDLLIRPHGRFEVSMSKRPSIVQAFSETRSAYYALCCFCVVVRPPHDDISPDSGTQRRPPEVRSTAFAARPSDLPPRSLIVVDFAIGCSLVRPGRPLYPLLVHRAAILLHASFRPHLAATPLRFANPSPLSGWIEDFHLQAADHARHTANGSARSAAR